MNERTERTPHNVTVGYDGSAGGRRALAWAAREAALRAAPLHILNALPPITTQENTWIAGAGLSIPEIHDEMLNDAEVMLKQAAESARELMPGLEVTTSLVESDPRAALLDAAAVAGLVVVGSRGLGPLRSLLLGSVGVALVRHSAAPVAVVRATDEAGREGVLVGTGGTASSLPALELAFAEAAHRHVPVTVLFCRWDGDVPRHRWLDLPRDSHEAAEASARIEGLLADLRTAYPDVVLRVRLTRGIPDRCLVDLGARAELVVVGRQGATPLDHAGLGTVATPVVEHANSVVIVVPTHQHELVRTETEEAQR